MHLNTDPDALPSIRDMAELMHQHLPPEKVIRVTPLKQLRRRCHEIVSEHPHLREEVPVVLANEQRRRRQYQRGLRVSTTQPLQRHA